MKKKNLSRRLFIQKSVAGGIGLAAMSDFSAFLKAGRSKMKFGLVTYQ